MSVNNKQFVQAWLKGGGRRAVAARVGMDINQLTSKGNYLRKKGVKLPRLDYPAPDVSVDYLNSLIERHK